MPETARGMLRSHFINSRHTAETIISHPPPQKKVTVMMTQTLARIYPMPKRNEDEVLATGEEEGRR